MNLNKLHSIEKISNNFQTHYKKGIKLFQQYRKYMPIVGFFRGFTWGWQRRSFLFLPHKLDLENRQ